MEYLLNFIVVMFLMTRYNGRQMKLNLSYRQLQNTIRPDPVFA